MGNSIQVFLILLYPYKIVYIHPAYIKIFLQKELSREKEGYCKRGYFSLGENFAKMLATPFTWG